jgi:GTP cyclohydrolase I
MQHDESTHYYGDDCQPPHSQVVHHDDPFDFGGQVPFITNPDRTKTLPEGIGYNDETDATYYAVSLLSALGVEATHHTARTAERFVSMLREMMTPEDFTFTVFQSTSDEMITMGPIPFYTLCAHHVVPFYGNVYIGYVPKNRIGGLSKLARAVKHVSKGLHVQEELTGMIAQYLEKRLDPQGIAVVLKAEHLCMAMRGVKQPGVITTTAAMKGVFADHTRTAKAEFMEWIRGL